MYIIDRRFIICWSSVELYEECIELMCSRAPANVLPFLKQRQKYRFGKRTNLILKISATILSLHFVTQKR